MTFVGLFTWNQNDFDLGDSSSGSSSTEKLGHSCFHGLGLHGKLIIIFILN